MDSDILRDRLAELGWTTYRLAKEVAKVREEVFYDRVDKFVALIPGIEKAIAAPERSSGKMLESIVIAMEGKLTVEWANEKTVSAAETVEKDF